MPRIFYIVLLSLAGVLIVLFIMGTILGLIRPRDAEPLLRFGNSPLIEQPAQAQTDDIRVFSGLGRLRIPLDNSTIMILSIAFPYNANDIAFTEELAAKIGEFRNIANDYFSSLTADKLINIDEEAAKTEILRNYNTILRLGRIEALYFSDMIIID